LECKNRVLNGLEDEVQTANLKGNPNMKSSFNADRPSRRDFTKSITAAFVASPLSSMLLACNRKPSVQEQRASDQDTKNPFSIDPTVVPYRRPILIKSSGSIYLESQFSLPTYPKKPEEYHHSFTSIGMPYVIVKRKNQRAEKIENPHEEREATVAVYSNRDGDVNYETFFIDTKRSSDPHRLHRTLITMKNETLDPDNMSQDLEYRYKVRNEAQYVRRIDIIWGDKPMGPIYFDEGECECFGIYLSLVACDQQPKICDCYNATVK
jgi:hypothetical protein